MQVPGGVEGEPGRLNNARKNSEIAPVGRKPPDAGAGKIGDVEPALAIEGQPERIVQTRLREDPEVGAIGGKFPDRVVLRRDIDIPARIEGDPGRPVNEGIGEERAVPLLVVARDRVDPEIGDKKRVRPRPGLAEEGESGDR